MTLTLEQIQRLHLEDGLISAEQGDSTTEQPFDSAADRQLRRDVRAALLCVEPPSIANAVMERVGRIGLPVAESVREDASGFEPVSSTVMRELGFSTAVSGGLRDAVLEEAGEFRSVWPEVAQAIGADGGVSLGGLLRDAVESESDFRSRGWGRREARPWFVPATAGVLLAAAAALLIWVGTSSPTVQDVAEKIATGPVDIEVLEVGAANAVQVLQQGEDEPTIILIEQKTDTLETKQ